jgi:hypothetical protein
VLKESSEVELRKEEKKLCKLNWFIFLYFLFEGEKGRRRNEIKNLYFFLLFLLEKIVRFFLFQFSKNLTYFFSSGFSL